MKHLFLVGLAVFATAATFACDGFVAGRKASSSGRVMVAHNEDNLPKHQVRHSMLPAGAPLFDEPGCVKIPQVADTCACFWSEVYSPDGEPKPGDFFYNENGVIIYSNNGGVYDDWYGIKYSLPDEGFYSSCTDGGLGINLRFAVAQRARTAAEGVSIMTNLVMTYGYRPLSRIFTIADKNEAWLVQVLHGRRFVARRCPDDEVAAYPNCLTISKIEPGDICSPNIESKRDTFDFAAFYQGPRTWKSPFNFHRGLDLYRLVGGIDVKAGEIYPFSLAPSRKIAAEDIKRGLSSHYEGMSYETKPKHPDKGPDVIEPICRKTTLESMVCVFGEMPSDTVIILATGRPCETPYIAFRPFAGILPEGTVSGAEAVRRIGEHFKPAPMMTEWGEKVTSGNAWREYPRPQMVREKWTCLNGDWDYAVTSVTNTPGRPEKWDGKIRVPYPIESALSGVGRFLEAEEFLWYTRKITVHPKNGFRTLLHFDGVDFRTQVYIGHDEVTDVPHAGAQEPFTLDITDYVKDGENELTLCVWDPTDGFIQSRGKQERKPFGCHYTRVSGIWQSVWMEEVPEAYIADYSVTPNIDKGEVTLVLTIAGTPGTGVTDGTIEIRSPDNSVSAAPLREKFIPGVPVTIKLPVPVRLWSPETPALYTFEAQFGGDRIVGYFGMRKFEVKKDAKGILRFYLNNQVYYPIGTLDQGWWPDGLLTPPSEDAMRFDIETLKKCGFNMMRKHIKVEPRRYYHLCDKIGLLVFQDLPCCTATWRSPMGADIVKCYGFQRYEMKAMMDNLGKVPCIVAWIPYNEGWGQPGEHLTHAMLDFVRRYDRTRVVSGPSGCWDWEGGHLLPGGWKWEKRVETKHKPAGVCEAADTVDMHLYRGPTMFAVNDRRASFLGEFGGLGHVVSNHVWRSERKIWGYQGMEDTATREGLLMTYLGLMDQVKDLAAKGLAGSVYTQTTDVENEVNGLLTYDRKVLKYDFEALKKAHQAIISAAVGQ